MELGENAEETLETLWISAEEKKEPSVALDDLAWAKKKTIEQLQKSGYIYVSDGMVRLTEKGRPHASNVVRRHRLAERLLADVLNTGNSLMHEKACKFEHLLDHGLDESICSLLGHPKICPHGKPIPPGRCCQQPQSRSSKLVSPLSQLARGKIGKVAYIYSPASGQVQKLVAMGILPGAPIQLIQSFPSYVFQLGQTQFAVDKETADAIYVRLVEEGESNETSKTPPPEHGWQRRLARRFGRRRARA